MAVSLTSDLEAARNYIALSDGILKAGTVAQQPPLVQSMICLVGCAGLIANIEDANMRSLLMISMIRDLPAMVQVIRQMRGES